MLLICIDVLPVYVSVYNLQAWCLWSPEEADRSPGTGLTDGCELPRGCWELNRGPVEGQRVLLTADISPALTFIVFCLLLENKCVACRALRMALSS